MKNKRAGFQKEELFISGQKSFGLTYSPAGEAEFSQSLSLALKGKLSEQVGFSANLSDRNLPSGSGTFSKRLEQFDQVGFGFNFPQGGLNLGDIFFKGNVGGLLNFERKISGLGTAVHTPKESLAVAFGSGPGEFNTTLLAGQEGKQGPYYFASSRSFIVRGSEKVYLDGALLASGREADYEIDYERGSVTFTPRRAVSSFSRIRVEYEYQSGPYAKNITAAQSATRLVGENLKLRIGYLSTKDKMDSPLLNGLSPEEKERLASAGGDSTAAVRDGAVFVGAGKGDYTAFLDSSGSRQYRYAGAGAGDYTVSFSLVRGGAGDYRYLGGGVYEYAGKGRGAYLPVLYLPMANSERGASVGLEFGPKNFLGFAEAALSEVNRNLFSNQSGVKSSGGTFVGGVRWQSSENPAVKMEARMKRREANFHYLGKRDESEMAYRWNLLPGEENLGQTQGEVSMSACWGWGESRLNMGGLSLAGEKRNGLGESELSLTPLGWLAVYSRMEAGRSNHRGGHYRTKNSVTGRWGALAATSALERERSTPFQGRNLEIRERFSERLEYKTYFFETSFGRREGYRNLTSSAVSDWGDLSKFSELRFGSSLVCAGEKLNAEGIVGWRRSKEGGRDVGRVHLFLKNNFVDGGKRFTFSHELSPLEAPSEVFSYVDIGVGNGGFRYENGQYVSDPYGNYTLLSEPAGETLAVYRIRQRWEADWEPYGSFGSTAGFWSQLSYRADFSFDGDFVRPKERTAVFPVLGLAESRRHELELRQTISYLPEPRQSRWELVWQEKNSRRNYIGVAAAGGISTGSGRSERKVGLGSSFYGQKLTQNYTVEYVQKRSAAGFWTPFEIRGWGIRNEWLYSFNRTVTLSLGGRYYRDKERMAVRPSALVASFPKLIFSFAGKGRVEAGLDATQVFGRPVSFEQADGNLEGLNLDYRFSLEYRVGPKLTASASFLGTQRPRLGKNQRASTHLSYLF